MIESMRIAGVATYGANKGELNGLSTVNYFFGSNGSGKTTLSNLIGDPTHNDFRTCTINWKNQTPLQTLVYNRDFVRGALQN
jgi:Fe-S cluster assembly ATPase SufC